MNTATKDSILSHYTTKQLEGLAPDSINAELQKRDYRLWEAGYMFYHAPPVDRERFRSDLAAYEREAQQRNVAASVPKMEPYPMFAQLHPPQTGMTREQVRSFVRPFKDFVNRKIGEAVGGLADAGRVADLVNRIGELEARLARYEGRVASVEQRFAGQARNLRNIEARLNGGQIEHSPKVPR
jgi:hypothetical protein